MVIQRWKKLYWVNGFNIKGYYSVSSLGRVRREVCKRPKGDKVLRGYNSNGYWCVDLRVASERKKYYVHQLVANAFIGHCPIGLECNHKDFNGFNNQVSNLEYVTRLDNVQRAIS